MTNFARVIDNTAVDVSTSPMDEYHPDLAAQFVEVPDTVERGWVLVKKSWKAPTPVPAFDISANGKSN